MKSIKNFQHTAISTAFASKVLGGGGDEAVTATNPNGADPKTLNGATVTITATVTVFGKTVTVGSGTYTFSNCQTVGSGIVCTSTQK